jgi:hypothetical protein
MWRNIPMLRASVATSVAVAVAVAVASATSIEAEAEGGMHTVTGASVGVSTAAVAGSAAPLFPLFGDVILCYRVQKRQELLQRTSRLETVDIQDIFCARSFITSFGSKLSRGPPHNKKRPKRVGLGVFRSILRR